MLKKVDDYSGKNGFKSMLVLCCGKCDFFRFFEIFNEFEKV